jgi:glycosyltransferase involved in cell wall biosynthesis
MDMKRLAIFTPTYNRAYVLPKLYESLCGQTCKDFEWLIVDDGSTDNTHELVEAWMHEDKVTIRYVSQENGGKMRAYNKAVSLTETELFVCIDSDDQLASESVVEDSLAFWDMTTEIGFPGGTTVDKVAGWVSQRKMPHSPDTIQTKPYCGMLCEICSATKGETTIFIRTEILKKYPYYVHTGERFIPDSYIYDEMDEEYLFLYHPYYSQICDYQDDGLTRNWKAWLFSNPYSYREYHAQRIRLRKPRLIQSIICYISISLYIGELFMVKRSPIPILTLLFYPLGCLKYLYDRYMLWKIK